MGRTKPARQLLSGQQMAHEGGWDPVHGVSDVNEEGKVTVHSDAGRTEYDADAEIEIR